jgi:ABC-type sugar transport system permease subunit
MMMSLAAVGLLWTLIYNPLLGLLNALLKAVGLVTNAHPLNVFGDRRTALYFAFAPVIWQGSGFTMVIFSAALQGIPAEILEASIMDGANKITQIRHIVLPYIFRTITITVTINMISGFKAFDLLKVLTSGGPASSTEITSLYMYREAFFAFNFGTSSTIAVMLFAVVLVCALGTNSLVDRLNKKVEP